MFLQCRHATFPHLFHAPAHRVAQHFSTFNPSRSLLIQQIRENIPCPVVHHIAYNISPHPHLLKHVLASTCVRAQQIIKYEVYQPFQHWTNFVKLDRANLALLRRVLERPSPHLPHLLPRYNLVLTKDGSML